MTLVVVVTSMCNGEAQSFFVFGFLHFIIASGFGETDSKLFDVVSVGTGGGSIGGDNVVSMFLPNDFVGLKLSAMRVKLNERLTGNGGGGGGGNRAGDQIGCCCCWCDGSNGNALE